MSISIKEKKYSTNIIKVIAAFFVIISHTATYTKINYINYDLYKHTISGNIIKILSTFGNTADLMFLVLSAWFLSESNKNNYRKIVTLFLDIFVISICSLFIAVFVFNKELNISSIKTYIFPNIYGECWYMTCYMMLYLLHTLLNAAIDKISINRIIVPTIVYYLINIGFSTDALGFNDLSFFIVVYVLIIYFKRNIYNMLSIKKSFILLLISLCAYYTVLLLLYKYSENSNLCSSLLYKVTNLYSPFHLLLSILIFSIINRLDINKHYINTISDYSGLLYVFYVFIEKSSISNVLSDFVLTIKNISIIKYFIVLFIISVVILTTLCFIYKKTIQKITINITENIIKRYEK